MKSLRLLKALKSVKSMKSSMAIGSFQRFQSIQSIQYIYSLYRFYITTPALLLLTMAKDFGVIQKQDKTLQKSIKRLISCALISAKCNLRSI